MDAKNLKMQIVSDLHIEFSRGKYNLPETDSDIIIIAGDCGVGFQQEYDYIREISQEHQKDVVFILGNHSFYQGGNVDIIRDKWLEIDEPGIHYLDIGKKLNFKGVNILGSILWTDFNSYNITDMTIAGHSMNDYNSFMNKLDSRDKLSEGCSPPYRFTPARSADEHYKILEWFEDSLKDLKGQTNVIVSHHLPSKKSISLIYRNSNVNHAYFSNLEKLMSDNDIALWVHGHSHGNQDYLLHDTRVVCNPRGYYLYEENMDFNPELCIELEGGKTECLSDIR
jgi:Icc-related predicted phosphoesterase